MNKFFRATLPKSEFGKFYLGVVGAVAAVTTAASVTSIVVNGLFDRA